MKRRFKISLETYCKDNSKEQLLQEFISGENVGIKPSEIAYASNEKVHWKCINGHKWEAMINNRTTGGQGCPYCKNKRLIEGENDFLSYCQKNGKEYLLEQYDDEKNKPLTVRDIRYGSHKKVWWRCDKGHHWESEIRTRCVRGNGCPFCTNRLAMPGTNDFEDYCKNNKFEYLIEEWNYEKNKKKPSEVLKGSGAKIWWLCKNNHSYQATIDHRLRGDGCPICSNKSIVEGFNDLQSYCENNELNTLIEEWDKEKNDKLMKEISYKSAKSVWWKCSNGHSYMASVNRRVKGKGICPICNEKILILGVNDFKSCYPKEAEQWNYEKNGGLKPDEITKGSSKKAWWKCSEGHEWEAVISSRKSNGCPVCANQKVIAGVNDFASLYPGLLNEWNYEKNKMVDPCSLSAGTSKKVWWKCSICGNEWEASLSNRTRAKSGCPKCGIGKSAAGHRLYCISKNGSFADKRPELLEEWDYEKNDGISPESLSEYSKDKVWWKCKKGHSWKAAVANRSSGTGCPECDMGRSTSFPEQAILFYLKKEFPDAKNRYLLDGREIDIYLPTVRTGIEYDGYFWHRNKKKKDEEMCGFCKERGVTLIRIREPKLPKITNGIVINRTDDHSDESLKEVIKKLCEVMKVKNEINLEKDRMKIYELSATPCEDSLETKRPDLVKQWHPTKNGKIKPSDMTCGSHLKAWWVCEKGHEFERVVKEMVYGNKCPICINRKGWVIRNVETGEMFETARKAAESVGKFKEHQGRHISDCCRLGIKGFGYHWERVRIKE